jgi:SAM-dependent methyltransferase
MDPRAPIRPLLTEDGHPEGSRVVCTDRHSLDFNIPCDSTSRRHQWQIALVYAAFIFLFGLLSPIYYLNRWDFTRQKKRNPFYTSKLVQLLGRYPLLYDVSMLAQNFPAWRRIYDVLPEFSGDVLQVGCGTGLLNKYVKHRRRENIRFTNMDANLNALQFGVRLGRYSGYVHSFIDKRTPLKDQSFDVVLFARSFHHVRNHRKAFAECARLLRDGGLVIVVDPVMLPEYGARAPSAGYMVNSSIDGVIWRFTQNSFVKHLSECLPPTLTIRSVNCVRQLHVSNYNLFVPQTDIIAVLDKRSQPCAG